MGPMRGLWLAWFSACAVCRAGKEVVAEETVGRVFNTAHATDASAKPAGAKRTGVSRTGGGSQHGGFAQAVRKQAAKAKAAEAAAAARPATTAQAVRAAATASARPASTAVRGGDAVSTPRTVLAFAALGHFLQSDAVSNADAVSTAPRTVHVVGFRATMGRHNNFYHFFMGRLAPLLSWWMDAKPKPNDVVVFNDVDDKKRDHWLLDLLQTHVANNTGVVVYKRDLGVSLNISRAQLGGLVQPGDVLRLGPFRRGMDALLYGCGSLTPGVKRELSRQIREARTLVLKSCGCPPCGIETCSLEEKTRRRRGPLRVTIVERHLHQETHTKEPRSVPNLRQVAAALAAVDAMSVRARSPRLIVKVVEFNKLTLCQQFCESAQTDVLVGQHGAGLTHTALLRQSAALVEIVPLPMDFKTIFHCTAGLRNAHYTHVLQNATHAPVDVVDAVSKIFRAVDMIAAGDAVEDEVRWPQNKLTKANRAACHPSQKPGDDFASLVDCNMP
ncbi:hypothetical protein M885DRAFT_527245 [Pelagophyceae sp. CCMP2097]|nr:hypothetical protein M885DRAFT_527245 [Pelagophyceae sp. CCMP2097]